MNSQKLLSFAAIIIAIILLLQPVTAATLRDVFGAFASLGKEKPEYDFDGSGGKITFGDVITALLNVFGLGGSIACSKVADCPGTTQGSFYCDENKNLVYDVTEYVCLNPGTPSSRCHASTKTFLLEACTHGCVDGNCLSLTAETCNNGVDDDSDRLADCDDNDCTNSDDCQMYCTTRDARFPAKGGIENVLHASYGCYYEGLDFAINQNTIFLRNLSGQPLDVYNASVSLGTSHFEDYEMTNCVFSGNFGSQDCPATDCEGTHYPSGYQEAFFIPSINGVPSVGEACTFNVTVPNAQEIQIGTSSFTLCSNRPISLPQECPNPTCPEPTEEMLRTHKDNPITITLNTSAGTITVYCYNFPVGPCIDGQQRDCPTQFGVCAGAKETCTNGAWPGCTAANYGASYETTETNCTDLQDSDCDGKFDCDDEDCSASSDCKVYATTYDPRFPVKGGITTAFMEVKGCIEVIDHLQSITTPPVLRLSPQADDNCTNWPIEGNTIYLKNLSGQTVTINNASVSLGTSHFDDYNMGSCGFLGHFSSERCPDSNSGDQGGFYESFGVTSINGVLGSTQECNINTSVSAGQEIRVGVSDFSYCASRLPPECECSTDELLRAHKDNPITITLNTSIGKLNIYLYNFPTDSPINNFPPT